MVVLAHLDAQISRRPLRPPSSPRGDRSSPGRWRLARPPARAKRGPARPRSPRPRSDAHAVPTRPIRRSTPRRRWPPSGAAPRFQPHPSRFDDLNHISQIASPYWQGSMIHLLIIAYRPSPRSTSRFCPRPGGPVRPKPHGRGPAGLARWTRVTDRLLGGTAEGRWRGISALKSPRLTQWVRRFRSTSATATVPHSLASAIGSPV